MKSPFRRFFSIFIILFLLCPPLWASEAGSSHYVPGAVASFIDVPSGLPYNFLNSFTGYVGSASVSREFPIAGLLTADVRAHSFAYTLAFQYDAPFKVLGGQYALTLALPVMVLDVEASIVGSGGNTISRSDSRGGLGDLYFSPLILFWKKGNFTYLGSVGIYAPSGAFDVGRLANLGKNYWTFTPQAGVNYSNQKNGLEATVLTGFNFNTKNTDTDYQSGHEFFLDFTVAKRFRNGVGVGGTGYLFQQISGDSGTGARLGSFKGRTFGLGPEVSYTRPIGKVLLAMEGKWLPEIEVQNRTQGHFFWYKLGIIFPVPQAPPPGK